MNPEDQPIDAYLAWIRSLTPEQLEAHKREARARTCANCTCHVDGGYWDRFCENCGCPKPDVAP